MDNKHRPKTKVKDIRDGYVEYDHIHNCKNDKGTPYTFINAEILLTDFWNHVDRIMFNIEEQS